MKSARSFLLVSSPRDCKLPEPLLQPGQINRRAVQRLGHVAERVHVASNRLQLLAEVMFQVPLLGRVEG